MLKVLIIDDDSRNIYALKAVLKARNYECVSAMSAKEGIGILSMDETVGIVLLDMMMPEMDGYEAIKVIRGGLRKTLPVISVTAQAMTGDKEKCLQAGANAYISKPIDLDQLLILLDRFIR